MEGIIKKILSISKIEAINKKDGGALIGYNLFEKSGERENKYALWLTKQDGSSTKAYTQYKTQSVGVGTQIGIAYKEEPNQFEYTDKKTGEKKTAKSTNRTITWFSEPSDIEQYDDKLFNSNLLIKDEEPKEDDYDMSKIPF